MADYCTVGFHATTKANAKSILFRHIFIDSNKRNEWLGRGFYFFAYFADAEQWCKTRKDLRGKETCILKADLKYNSDQLFDLDNPADLKTLEDILRKVDEINKEARIPLTITRNASWEERICAACNLVKVFYPNVGIIIYTFSNKQDTEFQNKFFPQRQRQMCVSDHSIIHNIRMEGS